MTYGKNDSINFKALCRCVSLLFQLVCSILDYIYFCSLFILCIFPVSLTFECLKGRCEAKYKSKMSSHLVTIIPACPV